MRDTFSPLADKVRGVAIDRIRRGQRSVPAQRQLEAELEEGEKKSEFVEELVDSTLDICREEADGSRTKFKVRVLGESATKTQPQIGECTITIEDGDERKRPTREGELVAIVGVVRDLLKDFGQGYVALARAVPNSLEAAAKLSAQLGESLAKSESGKHEWEYKAAEREAESILAGMRIKADVEKSDRMWTSIDGLLKQLEPWLEVAAELLKDEGVDPQAPTDEEIDAVFQKADPDMATLAKRFIHAKDSGEKENLRIELKRRWEGMGAGAKQHVATAVSGMEKKRVMVLGFWMKRSGLQ